MVRMLLLLVWCVHLARVWREGPTKGDVRLHRLRVGLRVLLVLRRVVDARRHVRREGRAMSIAIGSRVAVPWCYLRLVAVVEV